MRYLFDLGTFEKIEVGNNHHLLEWYRQQDCNSVEVDIVVDTLVADILDSFQRTMDVGVSKCSLENSDSSTVTSQRDEHCEKSLLVE